MPRRASSEPSRCRPAREWNSIQLDPLADIGALWPDVDGRDASLYDLFLGAASRNRTPAAGCFDFLRFARSTQGDAPLERQAELMAAYAPQFPSVAQHPALEVSLHKDHVNTFGGSRARCPTTRRCLSSPR